MAATTRPYPANARVVFLLVAVTCRVIGSAQVMGDSMEGKPSSDEGRQGIDGGRQQIGHSSEAVYTRRSSSSSSSSGFFNRLFGERQPRQQLPQEAPSRQQAPPRPQSPFQGAGNRESAGAMAAGNSYSHSRMGSQARGGNLGNSGYSYNYSSSSYRASGKEASNSGGSFHSASSSSSSGSSSSSSRSSSSSSRSSSSHGGSSHYRAGSEPLSGSAGYKVSVSDGRVVEDGSAGRPSSVGSAAAAARSRENQPSSARSASSSSHSSSRRSQGGDGGGQAGGDSSYSVRRQRVNVDRRRQYRGHSAGGQPHSEAGSSGEDRSRGRQHSSASSSAARAASELDRASALSSDSDQRSYYRQLFSRRCKDCTVKDKTYSGHSRFEYTEDCQRFRCICHCNGTHTCPPRYTLNVCQEGEEDGGDRPAADVRSQSDLRRRRCQNCEVLGNQFEGNAYFDVQDGCTKYRGCICYCNGTWVCPSERAVNTCPESTPTPQPSVCRACNARGKVVAANSVFELEEPCRRYSNCRCHCNGTWECPARFAQNTCQSPTARPPQQPGCGPCAVPGQPPVQGNTYFQRKEGCVEYKNCVCRCNGSWSCPSQFSRNTCQEAGSSGGRGSAYHLPASSSECQSCLAHGRYFRGNTYFNTRRGCVSYERCVCRCDGSWDCPSRYVTDLCRDDDRSNDVDNPNATCSFCDAEGKIVPPNSFFNLTKSCKQNLRCLCHCDGSWVCPEAFSRDICDGASLRLPQQPQPERDCSSCLVNSRVVRGNSYFDFTSACFRYKDCLCKCDGTYHCEQERAQNICNYSTTAAALSSSSSSSSSASSAASSPAQVVVTAAPSCVRCLAFGQLREWDRDFVHEEECVEYECHCHCNGTYSCPMERARRTCQLGCKECEVGGQFFEGNTYFQHTQDCVVYLCTCLCNGSFFCPPERANNTCQDGLEPARPPPGHGSQSAQGGVSAREGCQQCVTKDGVSHAAGSSFELHEGCIHYQCQCHCDGSWNCPGRDARNICRGEVLGGCRSCVLSDSQIYRGGEEFQMRDGCIHYQCNCNCDGSWQCPGDKARDICLGEVPGGCRVCRVSSNETYRGGSSFQLRQGCYHYQCQCHCNGSWECPGDTARDVCIGEVPGGCRVCKLDSGEVYLGESDFQMVKNCINYNCRCNCDGSWNCPGERARRVCNLDGSPLRVEAQTTTTTTTQSPPSSCRRCVPSEDESFAPNQPFTLRRGCHMYQCECECDGSWHCPASLSTNICRRRDDPQLRARTCSMCRVSSYTYPGRSSFLLTRGCAQYSCQCDCRGQWTCDHRVARNICQDDGEGPPGSSRSRPASESRQQAFSVLSSVSSDRSPHDAYRSLVSDVRTKAVNTARGSSVAAANLGSFQVRGQVSAPCRPCRVEGRDRTPNQDFVLQRKCKRFHCHCSCNGRWRCPRDRTEDLCADNGYKEEGGRRAGSARLRPLAPEVAGANRYWRGNVRVVGANSASSSSASSASASASARREGEPDFGDLNVRGYYVRSRNGDNRHLYVQSDHRQANGQLYGPADYRRDNQPSARKQSGSSASGGRVVAEGAQEVGPEEGGACAPCQVDDKRYSTGAHFDWRRGCVIYKCTCLCSGSYRCRLSMDPDCREEEAPPGSGGIPTGPAVQGPSAAKPGASCGNCYVQGFVYPGNMSFTLLQGCKELTCQCRCDGHHECADQKPIPGCVAMSTPLGNAMYPGGAASSVYPVGGSEPGARPGRVIHTFQQTYYGQCPSCGQGQGGPLLVPALLIPQQPSGQNPGQNPGQGPGQDPAQPGGQYRYPLAAQPQQALDASAQHGSAQSHAVHPGQRASAYPANPPSQGNPQHPNQPLSAGPTGVLHVPMQPMHFADNAMEDSQIDQRCATCFVHGQSRQGHFHYTEDCSRVTCYCDCAGRLLCSVQQTRTAECLPQRRPERVSGDCNSCMVKSQQHQPNSQFALRIGCYGYVCTCGCNGLWTCPRQQPTNYCVRPASPPTKITDEHRAMLAMGGDQARGSRGHHHHHPGGKAGLEDATYSRSAELKEGQLSRCRDCDVRGTTYPSKTRFFLRQDCLQYTCDCACDGSWACPKNLTVDVCQNRRSGNQQRQEMPGKQQQEEQRLSSQRRRLAEAAAHQASLAASQENCYDCQVKGEHFLPNAQFDYRQGCQVFTCHCFCNGSWECSSSLTRNVCQEEELLVHGKEVSARSREGCHPCRWGNATYAGGSNFSHTDGCWQFDCHCGCNGLVTCPPDNSKDLCHAGDSQALRRRLQEQNQRLPLPLDCKPCMVDGQLIRSRTTFNRREGCWEFLCECQCNGSWACPPDRSLNVCQLDTDSALSAPAHSPRPLLRQGCRVGRKTYFTRLFAFRDGCTQYMCICYDSGAWRCPQGKERRVC